MPRVGLAIAPGADHFPGFLDRAPQEALRDEIMAILGEAPLFRPRMPRTGQPFSVEMSNCGPLGWFSDAGGYRYERRHPETGRPWPPIPDEVMAVWNALADYRHPPEACLINYYDPSARMGLQVARRQARLGEERRFESCTGAIFTGKALRDAPPVGPRKAVVVEVGGIAHITGESRFRFDADDPLREGFSLG